MMNNNTNKAIFSYLWVFGIQNYIINTLQLQKQKKEREKNGHLDVKDLQT